MCDYFVETTSKWILCPVFKFVDIEIIFELQSGEHLMPSEEINNTNIQCEFISKTRLSTLQSVVEMGTAFY
ncbi:Nuclear distribution protein [Trichinella spiralis]|uniref:Nuclear distribution protein n=1 Tax=Trichinella spiralis TaxID=6334 RepID=A0ABR3KPR4_TRISP